jgi:hypothetical protein
VESRSDARPGSRGELAAQDRMRVTAVLEEAGLPRRDSTNIYSQPAGNRTQPTLVESSVKGIKTGVRTGADVNKSSQGANILTWGSSGEPLRGSILIIIVRKNISQQEGSLKFLKGDVIAEPDKSRLRRRFRDDQDFQNSGTPRPQIRFASPQRMTRNLSDTQAGGLDMLDGKLRELTLLIDQVIIRKIDENGN